MAMNNSEEPDAFSQGFHDIPDDRTLRSMSFIKLAELLSSCERGTTKYIVVDREVFRRKSRDQMWSTLLGAVIGGACTLAGAYIAVRYVPPPPNGRGSLRKHHPIYGRNSQYKCHKETTANDGQSTRKSCATATERDA